MRLVDFRGTMTLHPREELASFIGLLTAGAPPYEGRERRQEQRWRVAMVIPIVALNEHLQIRGKPMVGVSRDVSVSGLSFFRMVPIEERKLLAVELQAPQGDVMQAVLEVVHCRGEGPAYLVGGRFLVKVYVDG